MREAYLDGWRDAIEAIHDRAKVENTRIGDHAAEIAASVEPPGGWERDDLEPEGEQGVIAHADDD